MLVRASFALLIVGASLSSAFTVPTSAVATLRPSKYSTSSSPMFNKCPRPASTRTSIRLMAVDAAAVKTLVDKASAATGGESAPVKLAKALKKSTGALTVSLEYANPTASMDTVDSVDFRTLSADLRRDKGIAIMCDASSERGLVDLQNFEKEQGRWKGKFPGPCLLIASGGPYTIEQAAKAKAAGADGFYVPAAEAGKTIAGCHAMGIECPVGVSSTAEIESALKAGAKILFVHNGEDSQSIVDMRDSIPNDVVAVACLEGRGYGGPDALFKKKEAETAEEEDVAEILKAGYALRDAKYHGIMVLGACVDSESKEDTTYARWLSSQLNSKRSKTFSHLSKTSSPLGTGRPPAPLGGFTTVLEGSRPSHQSGRPG